MKPYILSAVFAVFCVILVLFYSPCMEAAAFGYTLWLDCIFPAVFPFMVCTHIIGESGILERLLKKNRRNLRIPMISLPIFLLCVISGIPSGARCGKLLYERGLMSKRGATIISASCNMASPMFIAGSLCSSILGFVKLRNTHIDAREAVRNLPADQFISFRVLHGEDGSRFDG